MEGQDRSSQSEPGHLEARRGTTNGKQKVMEIRSKSTGSEGAAIVKAEATEEEPRYLQA